MILQILANLFDEGYIDKDGDSLISYFFSGSNVAFRRQVFQQIGLYDTDCHTGEDQDISIRINATDWELYFQPKATVGHKCRKTVQGFIRQWYRYGLHHPYIFKKHNPSSLNVFRRVRGDQNGLLYKRILHIHWWPFHTYMFMSPFLLMNLFLSATVLAFAFNHWEIGSLVGFLTVAMLCFYFRHDIEWKNPIRTIQFTGLRFLVNTALFVGGLRGGLRLKMLYLSGTLDFHR